MKATTYEWPPRSQPSTGSGATLEQMQARTAEHKRSIEQRTANMLRVAESASQTGVATLEALHGQRETLRQIREDQRKIDDDLSTSDRLLKGLESWRGAATNALSSWWNGGGTEQCSAATDRPRRAVAHSTSDGGSRQAAVSGRGARPSPAVSSAAADDPLSQLSGIVSGLHVQATEMNAEIRAQSVTLEEALSSADAQSEALRRNTQRSRHLMGR
jgi:hypothetical protein